MKKDETKSRYLAEWIQEAAIRKACEDQEMPESRRTPMRWALTCKPSDEYPRRKATARVVILGDQHPEVKDLKV